MKSAFLPLALLVLLQACKKPDNAAPPVVVSPAKIKSFRVSHKMQVSEPDAFALVYRFAYKGEELVDTMQVSLLDSLLFTFVYERHPGYFIRREYSGNALAPTSYTDSFTTGEGGRITGKYLRNRNSTGADNIIKKTSFRYDATRKLNGWVTDGSAAPPYLVYNCDIYWDWAGNATFVSGGGGEPAFTPQVVGRYTYDTTKPRQLAHPLTLFALAEWGQPLVQCTNALSSQDPGGGFPLLSNVVWSGNRIAGYTFAGGAVSGVEVYSFTYY